MRLSLIAISILAALPGLAAGQDPEVPVRVEVKNEAPCAVKVRVMDESMVLRTIRVEAMGVGSGRFTASLARTLRYEVEPASRGCDWRPYEIVTDARAARLEIRLAPEPLRSRVSAGR